MLSEYRISTFVKTLNTCLGLFLVAVAVTAGFTGRALPGPAFIVFVGLFALLASFLIISPFRRKIVVTDDRIIYTGLFSEKEIAVSDIKGFRITDGKTKTLTILSSEESNRKISIGNCDNFSRYDEFEKYLKSRWKDLDALDKERETQELLQDTELGMTQEDRLQAIQRSKITAIVYNVLSVVLIIIAIASDIKWCYVPSLLYPLLGLMVMWYSKGLIKFYSNLRRSTHFPTFFGLFFPSVTLIAASLAKYKIFNAGHLWLPWLVVGVCFLLLLYKVGSNKSVGNTGLQLVLMTFVSILYGYGSIMYTNGAFDNGPHQTFSALVLQRRITHGKSTSYYLKIGPWGPRKNIQEVEVGKSLFMETQINDSVEIVFHSGRLHIPWYQVRQPITIINAPGVLVQPKQ
jgi:hypothetical protein